MLRHLPTNCDVISQVAPQGVWYAPAPKLLPGQPRGRGCPRKQGARLPGLQGGAADREQIWPELEFDQFGRHAKLWVQTIQALYYPAGKERLLTIVVVRAPLGKRPDRRLYSRCWRGTRGRFGVPRPGAGQWS